MVDVELAEDELVEVFEEVEVEGRGRVVGGSGG